MPYGSPLAYGQGTYKGVAIPPPATKSARYYFTFEPDWSTGIPIVYSFQTAMIKKHEYGEQRRALYDRPRRSMRVRVLEHKDKPTVQNFIEANHSNTIYVPVWTEPIIVTTAGSLAGETHFDTESLSGYYNLQELTEYMIVYDLQGALDAEVAEYANHTEDSLNLAEAFTQAYTAQRAALYPAMPAFIENKRVQDVTDTIVLYELTFREYY